MEDKQFADLTPITQLEPDHWQAFNRPPHKTAQRIQLSDINPNVRQVGPGQMYRNVQDAVDSITDSASDNPYLIHVDPGHYTDTWNIDTEWVTLTGSGSRATIFEAPSGNFVFSATDIQINNMRLIRDTGLATAARTLSRSGTVLNAEFHNLYVDTEGPGIGIGIGGVTSNATFNFYNCISRSEGVGWELGGLTRLKGCDTILHGATGERHTGIDQVGVASRIYVEGGNHGMDYWGIGGVKQLVDDDNVDCNVFLDSGDGEGKRRMMLFDVHAFCRNEGAVTHGTHDNFVINAKNFAWFRVWGGMQQAETPSPDTGNNRAFRADDDAKIETFATRTTKLSTGTNTFGFFGNQTITEDKSFAKFEGGIISINATGGPIDITLPKGNGTDRNATETEEWKFKRIDGSANAIRILGNGVNIDGDTTLLLPDQWDRATIVYNGTQYIVVG